MSVKIFILVLNIIIFCKAYKSYENYKVYKVIPNSEEHLQILMDMRKSGYYFWTDMLVVGTEIKVMVSPNEDIYFTKYMTAMGLNPVVAISNVQSLINSQLKISDIDQRASLGSFTWTRYHTLEEIHVWLEELENLYPGKVTTVTIGNGSENRPLKGVIIDLKAGQRGDKPLIGMIEGGIHAREWISPATVTWIIKELLTSDDSDVKFMAEAFVWHIFPVINPDGYDYTFTQDRMWRKNRNTRYATNCSPNNDTGNGVDLNRNFDYVWNSIGASSNPCDETFAGPSAGSEPETKAIMTYVEKIQQTGNLIYYIAFHSYSQMILIPYSHVGGADVLEAQNYGDLYEIAQRGLDKLTEKYGTKYVAGTSKDILYAVSGSSFDWAKGVANVPIVYLFELRDVGEFGFLLPPSQIIPNNEEIMACLVEMDKTTRKLGYYYSGSGIVFASFISIIQSIILLLIVQ